MSVILEYPKWEEKIFKLRFEDPVVGGDVRWSGNLPTSGHSNAATLQLSNRTLFLKGRLEDLESLEATLRQRVVSVEVLGESLEGRVEDLEGAVEGLSQDVLTYQTKVDMDVDTEQDEFTFARVVNDPDASNNGYYIWDGSDWVRSSFQPVTREDFEDLSKDVQRLAEEVGEGVAETLNSHIADADLGLLFFK